MIFKPRMYKKTIYDINYELLKNNNIKVLIFDLDNTLVKVGDRIPSNKLIDFIKKLKKDFYIIIASNNIKRRVLKISNILECDYLYSIMKPSKKIKKYLLKKNIDNMSSIAVIGDQLLTDILMGNRLDSYTVLVDPLCKKDLPITYFNRFCEKVIMKIIRIKRGKYYEE